MEEIIKLIINKILTVENIALCISMLFNVFFGWGFMRKEAQVLNTLDTLQKNNVALESVAKMVDQITDQLQLLLVYQRSNS